MKNVNEAGKRFEFVYPDFLTFNEVVGNYVIFPNFNFSNDIKTEILSYIYDRMFMNFASYYFRYNSNGIINAKVLPFTNRLVYNLSLIYDLNQKDFNDIKASENITKNYKTDNTTSENINGFQTDESIQTANDFTTQKLIRDYILDYQNEFENILNQMNGLFFSQNYVRKNYGNI